MYPAELVKPMREQLTNKGFNELFSEKDVDDLIEKKRELLKVYKSQDDVLDWFNWEHETIRKFR
mgnify:CR=1 FL=1